MFKLLLALLFVTPAFADDIRLFSGKINTAGLEIILKPGVKTYWRYPGDNGVPPLFNWDGSQNLKAIEVIYPTPIKFEDGIGHSIGYKKSPVFLIKTTPIDASKPVTLTLKLDYALCETMCVPAVASGKLTLKDDKPIAFNTPEKQPNRATLLSYSDKEITFKLLEHGDVLVEGPNEKWSLPFPTRDGEVYKLTLEGIPQSESAKGAMLKLTVLTPNGAYETELRLP
jgi:DsbC/DsbD-like thiol-disulfide interchange protein